MELAKLREDLEQARKQMREHAKTAVTKALGTFMAENPLVERLRWTQYTPYFNDGAPCTFRMNEIQIVLVPDTGGPEIDEDDDYDSHDYWLSENRDASPELSKINVDFNNLCSDLDSDVCKEAFGDHVQVTVTRDGVDVDEYDHD